MIYIGLAAAIVVIAIISILIGIKVLIKPTWILGWLRGTAGILLLLLAVLLGLSAVDFYSYKQLEKNQPIATLSFTQIEPKLFKVSVVDEAGHEAIYQLNGDLWQLDARILTWSSALARMGLLPGYRLDRISGRYVSLEEEKTMPRSIYSLHNNQAAFDLWSFLQDNGRSISIIKSRYGSATYLPMKDGALYSVMLHQAGLSAQPLNDRAKMAVENWQ